ncbi:MAG: asparagine synthase-related protein [Bacteroidales bacterium]|nr:asparagine synthase-related protein [Bacteroidales bacterium]
MKTTFKGRFSTPGNVGSSGGETYNGAEGTRVTVWGFLFNKTTLGYSNKDDSAWIIYQLFMSKAVSGLRQMDGQFTFLIETPQQVLIGRDHHGTGLPVFYTAEVFASSLIQLVETEGFEPRPDKSSIMRFLQTGYIPEPRTAFENIFKLGAGQLLSYQSGSITTTSMFPTDQIIPCLTGRSLEEQSSRFARLHEEAILRRIEGKQKIGILLSGGYDSGANLSALRKVYGGDIYSYSIGFKGNAWSELPLARLMADTFKTKHNEYEIDGSEIAFLPEIVRALGDPFVEGGLMVNYTVMKLAREDQPDVLLGGDGSDQYFGTGGREIALSCLSDKYGLSPIIRLLLKSLNANFFTQKDSFWFRLRFHLTKITEFMQGDAFGFSMAELKELVQNPGTISSENTPKLFGLSFEQRYIMHLYKTDIEKTINQVILHKASRMAELWGNNLLFPFMDLALYQFLQTVPVDLKCKGESITDIARGKGISKYLLKYHYKALIPPEITAKKKQGGFAPMPLFFDHKKQRDSIADYILSSAVCKDFLQRQAVERFIREYDKTCQDHHAWFWYRQNKAIQYFYLYTLAIWWDTFMKNGN